MSKTDDDLLLMEVALWRHLSALDVEDLRVRFAVDAEEAWKIVFGKAAPRHARYGEAMEDLVKRLPELAPYVGRHLGATQHDHVISEIAFGCAWHGVEDAKWKRAWDAYDGRRRPEPRALPEHVAEARRATTDTAIHAETLARGHEALGGSSSWRSAWARINAADALAPIAEAVQLGLWLFWVTCDEVVAVQRPRTSEQRGRLHREDGPAVEWPGGARYFFVRGVHVPERVVMRPAEIGLDEVLRERNLEMRRILLERYGHARFALDAQAKLVDADPRFGVLYRAPLPGDEPLVLVNVKNATAEPDGSVKEYWLRVPPDVRTAREAVAWTFGFEAEDYSPLVET